MAYAPTTLDDIWRRLRPMGLRLRIRDTLLLASRTLWMAFAAGALAAAQEGLPWIAPIAWLGAALVLAVVLAPLACAAALRIALDS